MFLSKLRCEILEVNTFVNLENVYFRFFNNACTNQINIFLLTITTRIYFYSWIFHWTISLTNILLIESIVGVVSIWVMREIVILYLIINVWKAHKRWSGILISDGEFYREIVCVWILLLLQKALTCLFFKLSMRLLLQFGTNK